jgi:hypothetical protein
MLALPVSKKIGASNSVRLGVAEGRLTSTGFGSDSPLEDNKTEAGRTQNRRVESTSVGELGQARHLGARPQTLSERAAMTRTGMEQLVLMRRVVPLLRAPS